MSSDPSSSGIVQKADQIAFHFYTKLFYTVNQARATEEAHSQGKIDKWFNLETPDSDLFTREAREPYRNISLSPAPGPPPLEIQILLCIPELTNNQVLVHRPDDSSNTIDPSTEQPSSPAVLPSPTRTSTQLRIEPTPRYIVLETWTLTFNPHGSSSRLGDQALPTIYKHGIPLFRTLYSLLRVLPVWKLHKRLKRRTGVNRNGNLGISLRVRPLEERDGDAALGILDFDTPPSPSHAPLLTQTHTFSPLPHPLGSLTLSATYLSSPNFELDELESHLSSRFISLDLQGFVPTLSKHAVREEREDSTSGVVGPGVGGARSPPRAIVGATEGGRGGQGRGLGLGLGTGLGLPSGGSAAGFGESTSSISSMGRPVASGTNTTSDHASVAERFIIPSRVPSLGPSSSSSSALIPPPRPQFTPFPLPLPFPTAGATSPSSDPSSAVSGLALHRTRIESSNSPSITSPGPGPGVAGGERSPSSEFFSSSISPHRTTHSPHPHAYPYQSSSLSSSPISGAGVGAVPIRGGMGINPFKGNTLSSASASASGSSPSLSIRQGLSSGLASAGIGHGATPSSLGDRKGPGLVERDYRGRISSESERGEWDRDDSRERDRHRTVSSGYNMAPGSGSPTIPNVERQEDGTGGVGVPTRIQPTRKRYSSSFGNRYVGSVGSGGSGVGSGGGESGGSTPASVGGGTGAATEGREQSATGGVASFLSTATDDDDISIFVQHIDSRKPLSGRVKEKEKRERDRARDVERGRGEGQDHDRETTQESDKGKRKQEEAEFVTSPVPWQRQRSPRSPLSPLAGLDREGGQQQKGRVVSPTRATTRQLTAAASASESTALSVPASGSTTATAPETTAPLSSLSVSPPAPTQLSTSPNRGPMLTNPDEVDERLKQMNETFRKSLEGIGSGGSVGRRRDKGKETEKDTTTRRTLSLLVSLDETSGAAGDASSGGAPFTHTKSSSASPRSGEQHPNPIPIPRLSPILVPSSSPSSSTGTGSGSSSNQHRSLHPQAGLGLGLGLGRGRGFIGSISSTSTSTSASSEAIGASVSQGSEEVIGRMDFYDSDGLGLGRRPRGF